MNSYGYSRERCYSILDDFFHSNYEYLGKNISNEDMNQLYFSCLTEWDLEKSDMYSKPMVWIGIYIAIASFFCILAMAADLLHGFRNKKSRFPCKYFSLNAASITMITVALKLPVDLSGAMPRYMEQATKLGSLGFMCTMMANLMPSLSSMDNETLLANVIGLLILVITVIVNICIQINTSVISNTPLGFHDCHFDFIMAAYIYVTIILLLLIVAISLSLAIPPSKEILDSKYKAANKISLTNQSVQHIQVSKVEKLRRHVRRYWVMATTGNPQFVMTSYPLSTFSGIICVIVLVMNLLMVFKVVYHDFQHPPVGMILHTSESMLNRSSYGWSTTVICITQSVGIIVGTIAPIFRCFSVFSFKLAVKWNKKHFMLFKVEKYWTQKLYEWKQSPITFLSIGRRSRSLICNSKNTILSLCIALQKLIIVSSKMIWLIATVVPVLVVACFNNWKLEKARRIAPPIASRIDYIHEDLNKYVIQVDNETEFAENTLKGISTYINSFISKAEKKQNKNLLELLNKSTGFKAVETFDTDHVQPLLQVGHVNTWSLPIVTLTSIAAALPNIHEDITSRLINSVGEGLSFTHLVEESLNGATEYVNIRKTSMILWHEIEHKRKWLDTHLATNVHKGKTATEIVKSFSDTSKEIVKKIMDNTDGEDTLENPQHILIAANSMYRITQTILLRYQSNIEEPMTKKQLFAHLNGMIADIFSACFTNIPRVIITRCHESVIEKREASVKVAAKLLGKTTKIIERLDTVEVPSMDEEKMAYIDEWRLFMKQSVP